MLKDFRIPKEAFDCVKVSDFSFFEEDYLLRFDPEVDTPADLKKFIKPGKVFRKFFAVRDIYKFLNREKLSYSVRPENLWWFGMLMNPNLAILRSFTLGKDRLCKILANVLAIYLHKEISDITKLIQRAKEQAISDGQPIPRSLDDLSKYLTPEEMDILQERISDIERKINTFSTEVYSELRKAGKNSGTLTYTDNTIGKVELPRSVLQKLKNIGQSIYGFYESQTKVQVRTNLPFSEFEIALSEIDKDIFLQKVLDYAFVKHDFISKLRLDLFLDKSGSMDNSLSFGKESVRKIEIAKGVIKELLRMGVKFRKFYGFDNEVQEVSDLASLLRIRPDGGTSIKKVLEKIRENDKPALVITDLEDDVVSDSELLASVKNKVSMIMVGDKRSYESWKDVVGIAHYICPE